MSKSIENTVLDTAFYEEVIDETNISGEIKEEILMNTKKAGGDQKEITEALNETVGEEWIEKKSLNITNNTLKWLKGYTDKLETKIELGEKKEGLAESIISKQEIEDEETREKIKEKIINEIPNEIDPINEETKKRLEKVREYYSLSHFLPYIILIIFLIIYILLAKYNSPYWIGYSIALSGIFLLITLTIGKIILIKTVSGMMDKAIINSIANIGFRKAITYPIASIILGILIVGCRFSIKKIKYKRPENKK